MKIFNLKELKEGEMFRFVGLDECIYKIENEMLYQKAENYEWEYSYTPLNTFNSKVRRFGIKIINKYTEFETELAKHFNPKWKYIARDKNGVLFVYAYKPQKADNMYKLLEGESIGKCQVVHEEVFDVFPNIKFENGAIALKDIINS